MDLHDLNALAVVYISSKRLNRLYWLPTVFGLKLRNGVKYLMSSKLFDVDLEFVFS